MSPQITLNYPGNKKLIDTMEVLCINACLNDDPNLAVSIYLHVCDLQMVLNGDSIEISPKFRIDIMHKNEKIKINVDDAKNHDVIDALKAGVRGSALISVIVDSLDGNQKNAHSSLDGLAILISINEKYLISNATPTTSKPQIGFQQAPMRL